MTTRPILCFGEALIDFHAEAVDEHGFPRQFVPFAGGAPANVAVAVARLGGEARFAGMLGRDQFGDFLFDNLQRAGVATRDVARCDHASTALAFVTLDNHGERSFSFYREHSADLSFRACDFREDAFDDLAVFHVCSNSMTDPALAVVTREGMERARDAGALISFDVNLRPALWRTDTDPRPTICLALEQADVVKMCAAEFAWLADNDEPAALERLWQGRARLLVITDGAAPMRWFHPDAEGELPCYSVQAVDCTAAGDAFVGGLLCRLAELEPHADRIDRLVATLPQLHATLRYAAACGALTATRRGSFNAIRGTSEVDSFMQAQT